jgi:cell division protein FtsB
MFRAIRTIRLIRTIIFVTCLEFDARSKYLSRHCYISYYRSMDFQEKKMVRKLLYSKFTVVVLVAAFFFLGNAAMSVYVKYKKTKNVHDVSTREFRELEARKNALQEEVTLLKTEEGVEQKIREEYGFAKEGEGVVIIIENKNKEGDSVEDYSFSRDGLPGIWERVTNVFTRE